MTDRVNALTVVLTKNMRTDDVEGLVNAILYMKGVASVGTNIVDTGAYAARMQMQYELQRKIMDVLYPAIDTFPESK